MMAAAAEQGADSVWLTSDNPRYEDPQKIISDTLEGFAAPEQIQVQVDRRLAIQKAIAQAQGADLVLLAGKGHENYQEINGERLAFSDVEVASDALRAGGFL